MEERERKAEAARTRRRGVSGLGGAQLLGDDDGGGGFDLGGLLPAPPPGFRKSAALVGGVGKGLVGVGLGGVGLVGQAIGIKEKDEEGGRTKKKKSKKTLTRETIEEQRAAYEREKALLAERGSMVKQEGGFMSARSSGRTKLGRASLKLRSLSGMGGGVAGLSRSFSLSRPSSGGREGGGVATGNGTEEPSGTSGEENGPKAQPKKIGEENGLNMSPTAAVPRGWLSSPAEQPSSSSGQQGPPPVDVPRGWSYVFSQSHLRPIFTHLSMYPPTHL